MADDGPKRIKYLLDLPSTTVAQGSQSLVAGLTKPGDQDFKVRRSAYEGLSELRAYYRNLKRSVNNVETSSRRKREVLTALTAYNAALSDFDKALRDTSDDQVTLLRQAASRSRKAASSLAKAREALG